MEKRLFTSESVTEGHPDKICDAISDAILDALLEQDPMSRVACETCTTTGYVMVMGEITSNAHIDFQQVVRDTVREIGYDRAKYGFDADTCAVVTAIDKQSTDIAMGVDKALEAKENNMSDEEIDAIGDFIEDDNVPAPAEAAAFTLLKEQLDEVLSTLTDREQKVLRLRFGLEDGRARTLEEVGKEFKVTRERIRQIEAKALRKLRHPSRSRKLKDYLD